MQIILNITAKTFKITLFAFIVISGLTCEKKNELGKLNNERDITMPQVIDIRLLINKNNENIIATLILLNPNQKSFFIEKSNVSLNGIMEKELFDIKTLDGDDVPYLGITIKRSPAGKEDYVEIKPKEKLTSNVNLSKYYDLSLSQSYVAKYSAFNSFPDGSDIVELTSESVEFSTK